MGIALLGAAALLAAAACRDRPAGGDPAPERFEGVRRQAAAPAAPGGFCERTYPPGGAGARRWAAPPLQPVPGAQDAPPPAGSWIWVNLWATWCAPCLEEMELLGRWREGLSREGARVAFELVSVDDADAGAGEALAAARARGLPGSVRWLRSQDDLPPLLDALGVDRAAVLPIHALVDPAGWLRCVRVGAVHEQDWASAKALFAR